MEIAARQRASYELEKKIRQYNETAGEKSQQVQRLQEHLSYLQQYFQVAQQQIELLELQSGKLQKSISALNKEADEISSQLDTLVSELGPHVVNIYKYGSREVLSLVLSAESAHEAVTSAYLLGRLARHDRIVVEELLYKIGELEHGKRGIEKNKAKLMTRAEELDSLHEKYSFAISQTNEQLTVAQRERQRIGAAIKEMERTKLETERVLAELARKKRARPQDEASTIKTNAKADSGSEAYPTLEQGVLLDWPVTGAIVSHYGPREHPVSKAITFYPGIGISVPSGTQVKAAGPGKVLYEGWLQGFGQVVIIDHGRNISTVYAHLATTLVKEKDAVMHGTVIGSVGSTGTAEGFNLHFEVRIGGAAKNPLDYLKKT